MKNVVLKVDDVSMKFNLMEKKVDNLKEFVIKLVKNEIRYQEFWALHNISFSINKGDRLGILGLNGAGKSTLLKIIAGVLKATEGKVTVKGKIVPLLELGAGFDPQYTGVENIYLYGAILGYPKDFIREKFDEIVEFSDLGDFIHVPVKNYSSGMKARLGFSIATVMEPEILILDEVLSVGDAKFRKKSEQRIQTMFDQGVTVLFVSHSIDQIKRICNKAIILDKGKLIADGPVEEVCAVYESMIDDTDMPKAKKPKKKKKKKKPVVLETAMASEEAGAMITEETPAIQEGSALPEEKDQAAAVKEQAAEGKEQAAEGKEQAAAVKDQAAEGKEAAVQTDGLPENRPDRAEHNKSEDYQI